MLTNIQREALGKKLGIENKPKIYIIPVNNDNISIAFKTAELLREELFGIAIIITTTTEHSLRSNMRRANKENCDIVMIFDKERFPDCAVIKDMKNGNETIIEILSLYKIRAKIIELLGIGPVKDILLQLRDGELKIDIAEFLLEMYYKKGIV